MNRCPKFWLLSLAAGWLIAGGEALANYAQAQAAFRGRDYVTAANGFFQTYTYPKEAGEKFKAEWGLAQSLQNLGLFYSSSKYYSVIVARGPKANNPFFRQAMEELGKINSSISLGQSHIVQLFRKRIDPAAVPGPARGFYFYYLGVEAFNDRKFEVAQGQFRRVPSSSPYYLKALFHLGVIANLSGRHSQAISFFERVRAGSRASSGGDYLREQADINIARVYYETKQYREGLMAYGQVSRDSEAWLNTIFESAWTFFMIQKHNNTLGQIHTIHSPFFENRFFPESYILQAITFLRLCRFDDVKDSLRLFRTRYKPVFDDVKTMLGQYEGRTKGFFKLVYDYDVGSLNRYKKAWSILDALKRSDAYREARNTVRFSDQELARLGSYSGRWGSSGLLDELKTFLQKKKDVAVVDAGKRLYNEGTAYYAYLRELSDQTRLINAEMLLGKINDLRKKINVGVSDKKANFIGGLQPLKVGQDLEYWPFEGEYWEDELGGYVFNIGSKCNTSNESKN